MSNKSANFSPEWIEWESKVGIRPLLSGDAYNMRAQFEGLRQLLQSQWGEPDSGVSSTDVVTDKGIQARVYSPTASAGKKVPMGVFYHCGGYCIGSIEAEDVLVRNLCLRSQTVIISIEYRLAPEHTAPTALQDCCDATLWAIQNADKFGADCSQVYTIGPSAGAALAVSVFLKLYDGGFKNSIKGIVSMSPCWIHPDNLGEYKDQHKSFINSVGNLPVIDANSMRNFYDTYKSPLDDKYTFALGYPDLSVLPRLYLVGAELDPLRDDAVIFDKKLSDAGVDHKLKMYLGLPHVFWLFPLKASLEFFDDTAKGISYVLEK
ncbi:putative alpha beta hydrolase fold protein [Lipomyces arxii]|uniref:putative alpha beta hydrolase fold protein n=1 Tax=Lipomyces arxii TaxID=56418 RepID=UPI0034CD3B02